MSSSPPDTVAATTSGFPSPAEDHGEARIDLNVELIPRPLSTVLLRLSDGAMQLEGISDGDLLVIDRSVDARPGMVVVAIHGGAFLLGRLRRRGDRPWLVAGDGVSPPLPLAPDPQGAELWGVVLHAVHVLPQRRTGLGRSVGPGQGQLRQLPPSAQLLAKRLGQGPPLGTGRGRSTPGPTQVGSQGQQPQGEAEADEQLQAELEQGRAQRATPG